MYLMYYTLTNYVFKHYCTTRLVANAKFRECDPIVQKCQLDPQWVQFGVVTVCVANVGHIAGSPVGHSVCLLGDVIDV